MISPWVAGQTSATWTFPCQRDGGKILDLTNQIASNISVLFYNNVQTANVNGQISYTKIATGAGTVIILSLLPGIIQYFPASADTVNLAPGQYWIRVKVNYNGTSPDYCDYIPLFIGA